MLLVRHTPHPKNRDFDFHSQVEYFLGVRRGIFGVRVFYPEGSLWSVVPSRWFTRIFNDQARLRRVRHGEPIGAIDLYEWPVSMAAAMEEYDRLTNQIRNIRPIMERRDRVAEYLQAIM